MNQPKIIAVDFDGCLVTNRFPDIGEPIAETIAALKREQEAGAKVILWTCRREAQVEAAAAWCAEQGIHVDAVNRNLPEIIEAFGGDTVKVFANEYWDDRAVLMPPLDCRDVLKSPDDTCYSYKLMRDKHDTLMKRWHDMVEVIRQRVDKGGLTPDEEALLRDMGLETSYDRRTTQ